MAWGNVTVTGQDGRAIFLDGNYESPCGTAPGPFVVSYGKHTFETLDAAKHVAAAGDATVNQQHPAVSIVLKPVQQPGRARA
jgi:hypothetical protein